MAMGPLILVANPGSASRKYAVFAGHELRAQLHFEYLDHRIVCTLLHGGEQRQVPAEVDDLTEAIDHVLPLLHSHHILKKDESVSQVGLRVVAPGSYFLRDQVMDDEAVQQLALLESRAPLHISATLAEARGIQAALPQAQLIAVSDSAFHAGKATRAWNYGLPLHDADRFEIKRFGYHGLSAAAAVAALQATDQAAPKMIICHLGSGVSVTAVHHGQSIDTSMGYSPLEGTVMATRSGTIDPTAVWALKEALQLDDNAMEAYLNQRSGLLGLGGSADIRELLTRAASGDNQAILALDTFVYSVQKAIGAMAAALDGVDVLVMTGTVGERSAPIRARILSSLTYLNLTFDESANQACIAPSAPTPIGQSVIVVPTDEAREIARHVRAINPDG